MERLGHQRAMAHAHHRPFWVGEDWEHLSRGMRESGLGITCLPGATPEDWSQTIARSVEEQWPLPSEANRRLLEAVLSDDPHAMTRALGQGADPNARCPSPCASALSLAVEGAAKTGKSPACAEILLKQPGIQVNGSDIFGETPLHTAAAYGSSQLCSSLLQNGADPSKRNAAGQTPVQVAMMLGEDARGPALQVLRNAESSRGLDSTNEWLTQHGLPLRGPQAGLQQSGPQR